MIDKKKLVERTKRYEQSEKGRARRKRYYEKNRDKILKYQREYYKTRICIECGKNRTLFQGICGECELKGEMQMEQERGN